MLNTGSLIDDVFIPVSQSDQIDFLQAIVLHAVNMIPSIDLVVLQLIANQRWHSCKRH